MWYDDGVKAGTHYPTYIADHVEECSLSLMFVSRASLDSDWCNNEVHYALDSCLSDEGRMLRQTKALLVQRARKALDTEE